jgi:hypothetical protein
VSGVNLTLLSSVIPAGYDELMAKSRAPMKADSNDGSAISSLAEASMTWAGGALDDMPRASTGTTSNVLRLEPASSNYTIAIGWGPRLPAREVSSANLYARITEQGFDHLEEDSHLQPRRRGEEPLFLSVGDMDEAMVGDRTTDRTRLENEDLEMEVQCLGTSVS